MKTKLTYASFLFFCAFSLCSCQTSVKEFNSNREKYIATKFSPANLPASVREPIEKVFSQTKKFKKITMKFEMEETRDTIVTSYQGAETVYAQDHGLVLVQNEYSQNGFAYRVNNSISLMGLLSLDEQSVFLKSEDINRQLTDGYVKKINLITPALAQIKENSNIALDFIRAFRPVNVGYNRTARLKSGNFKINIAFGARYPASKVHHTLKGDAVNVICTIANTGGTPVSRHDLFYLMDYGVAIPETLNSSSIKQEYTIQSVEVE